MGMREDDDFVVASHLSRNNKMAAHPLKTYLDRSINVLKRNTGKGEWAEQRPVCHVPR